MHVDDLTRDERVDLAHWARIKSDAQTVEEKVFALEIWCELSPETRLAHDTVYRNTIETFVFIGRVIKDCGYAALDRQLVSPYEPLIYLASHEINKAIEIARATIKAEQEKTCTKE